MFKEEIEKSEKKWKRVKGNNGGNGKGGGNERIKLEELAKMTSGMSPAMIKNIIN